MLVTDRKRSFIVVHMTGNWSQIKNLSIRYYVVGMHEVITETVGQFTGLLDKNGEMIFEGDIDDVGWIVCFEHGVFCIKQKLTSITYIPLSEINNINIIGNIHDNPELL